VPTVTEPQLLTFKNWIFRFRPAQVEPVRLLILLHGWMGDENSMWVLARKLSPNYTILAPRGIHPIAEGGFSWREIRPGSWGKAIIEDLHPAVEALLAFIDDWSSNSGVDARQFDLMGFSQGAALAYTLALIHPERVKKLAALSGFIPENEGNFLASKVLSGESIFIAHGRKDDMIPVEKARKAVELLGNAGAHVTYCESDTGHRVSKECLHEMKDFLEVY
jgi:phospholipase/carboxylesterase